MKNLTRRLSVLIASIGISASAFAATQQNVSTFVEKKLDLTVEHIQPAAISGFYKLKTAEGTLYVSNDKKQLFWGELTQVTDSQSLRSAQKKQEKEITSYLENTLNTPVERIKSASVPGFYEATTSSGMLYVSHDKGHMFYGNLYRLKPNGIDNMTEQSQRGFRAEKIAQFEKDMIVFPAKNEKHVVTVFTDVSCGYCKKLHSEIDQYNAQGITIRYMAFPRGGVTSDAFQTMQKVWCAPNPLQAMTQAKQGSSVEAMKVAARCDEKIKQQYELGMMFGINGTPR